jgi:hypothetical protein
MGDAIRKVRIVGDGTWQGTQILTEDGTPLENVLGLSIELIAGQEQRVRVSIRNPEVDVVTELVSKAALEEALHEATHYRNQWAVEHNRAFALEQELRALRAERSVRKITNWWFGRREG